MTTTRDQIEHVLQDFYNEVEACGIDGSLDKIYTRYTDRLLALTSSGGVEPESEQFDKEIKKAVAFGMGAICGKHNVRQTADEVYGIVNDYVESHYSGSDIARWLRSKGKVRVPLFKLVDPIRIEQVVPLRVEVGDHIHTVQPVIEGNTIVWRWPTHTAQDGGLPTKKCGCPNDLCCDECYQINLP